MDDLLSRARTAWARYAGLDDGFRPGQLHLGVHAGSRICPPGWTGIVVLGDAAIVTAPAAQAERELRRALAGVLMDQLTDPSVVVPAGHAADVLGPANLAFTDAARFRGPAPVADPAGAGDFAGPGTSPMPVTQEMPVTDQRMQRLLASVSAEDAAETDLARMSSAVQVVLDGGRGA